MFTINLTQRFSAADIGVLRDFIGKQRVWCVHSMYETAMLRTAGPERRRHLEQVQANQDHLPELVRQYLQAHDGPYHGNAAAIVSADAAQPSMLTAEATVSPLLVTSYADDSRDTVNAIEVHPELTSSSEVSHQAQGRALS